MKKFSIYIYLLSSYYPCGKHFQIHQMLIDADKDCDGKLSFEGTN